MAMNPGPDMEHDPQLAEIYRAGAEAGPPARLDHAIRAAARREVNAGPRRGGLRRWQLPLAMAAILVLSVTVVTQMREQGADRPEALLLPPAEVQPRAAEKSPADSAPSQVMAVPEAAAVRRQDKPAPASDRPAAPSPPAMASEQKTMAAPAESRVAPAGADAAPAVAEDAAGARLERQAPRPLLRSAPAPLADSPAGLSAAAPARSAVLAAPEPGELWRDLVTAPPERWIERIVELRRAGKTADADALAAEFGRRFPDQQLPVEAR